MVSRAWGRCTATHPTMLAAYLQISQPTSKQAKQRSPWRRKRNVSEKVPLMPCKWKKVAKLKIPKSQLNRLAENLLPFRTGWKSAEWPVPPEPVTIGKSSPGLSQVTGESKVMSKEHWQKIDTWDIPDNGIKTGVGGTNLFVLEMINSSPVGICFL